MISQFTLLFYCTSRQFWTLLVDLGLLGKFEFCGLSYWLSESSHFLPCVTLQTYILFGYVYSSSVFTLQRQWLCGKFLSRLLTFWLWHFGLFVFLSAYLSGCIYFPISFIESNFLAFSYFSSWLLDSLFGQFDFALTFTVLKISSLTTSKSRKSNK